MIRIFCQLVKSEIIIAQQRAGVNEVWLDYSVDYARLVYSIEPADATIQQWKSNYESRSVFQNHLRECLIPERRDVCTPAKE